MMNYLQRLGRSLMLPVAVLPAAAVLLGVGAWIGQFSWGEDSVVSAFMIAAGDSIIGNMGMLFALGVALGLSKDKDGAAALSGLVAFLVITEVLSVESVAELSQIAVDDVNPAFGVITNQFIGILSGVVASIMYNRFSHVQLPAALAFFSGKRLVPIVTAAVMMALSAVFFYIWPYVYNGLVTFGMWISQLDFIGAGLYGFFNRLLIPTGLHHALNSVFWFDVAGINDIGNYWDGEGEVGITGRYQAGFFPIMMFGVPAAALAMYHTAHASKKKQIGSLMLAAGFAAFLTGVTEPIEFAFMFVAPLLFVVHAVLTGLSLAIAAFFQWTAGFSFSAGLLDFFLGFPLEMANQPYMLLVQGVIFGTVYYVLFRFLIVKFNLMTPGREPEGEGLDISEEPTELEGSNKMAMMASTIYQALGGDDNVVSIDNCVTRLRLEVKDMGKVDQAKIKQTGVPGINVVSDHNIQVVVGTQVQFVADEMNKIRSK
ncbi:N-acetylglucosamine-specific PTS transporter subunit IIBC [Alkalihalobacillus sp. LMS6]|uniref:N-acetylglucosamine-specific PTS transporter subunit IIBC n=1 Tax=Alkalihalobacillus sp. LMS6 TaxID=2924034 RepID=UPI0020D09C2E|nr:N-acetylglucosamine-specific PTS transporter subunit IIBC [Alkalihalobacillus sp. LMS6]UTR08187.1 N-acetylglucosamine-specific PTS transporter subunit IIBC [Alkalihalobacillus sp. LMS6]